MKKTADSTRKLWQTLGLLTLAILLVIVIDSLSFPTETAADALASDESNAVSVTADPTAEPKSESTALPEIGKPEDTVRLTFLGECAPGSPFATNAYGSLNALTAEKGTAYFFSAIRSVLASDDLTIAANTCVYTDSNALTASPLCAAAASAAAVYSDGSVEAVVDFSDADADTADATKSALTEAGLTVADGDAQFFEIAGVRIALFTTKITKDSDHSLLLDEISETTSKADYVILYFFGGEENAHTVEIWMKNALYTFADTGVDLLVGAGNGVLRPCEYYGNSVIAYSLGSLIDGSQLVPENASALLQVDLHMDADGNLQSAVRFIPCFVYGSRWQPALMTDDADIDRVQRFLSDELQMPIEIAE